MGIDNGPSNVELGVTRKPFEFQEANPGKEPPIIGDEIIRPSAMRPEEQNPDGSWNRKPSEERGWLNAISRAYAKKELPQDVMNKNIQEIINAAITAGVSRDKIGEHLQTLGINAVKKEDLHPSSIDLQKPIDPHTYNELAKRFNELRARLITQNDRVRLAKLDGAPVGRILRGAFPQGDTPEGRLAYKQITELLNEVEGNKP